MFGTCFLVLSLSIFSMNYRCFSNGLQRYALFLSLQIFSDFFFEKFRFYRFTAFITQIHRHWGWSVTHWNTAKCWNLSFIVAHLNFSNIVLLNKLHFSGQSKERQEWWKDKDGEVDERVGMARRAKVREQQDWRKRGGQARASDGGRTRMAVSEKWGEKPEKSPKHHSGDMH